ncbi:MAG: SDR family NAD(P)-dependent oxidoreductase [Burkholderiales bacterium]
MRLKNKVALVTGAGRGIGKAIAARFAQEGASVIVSDADGDGADRVAAGICADGHAAAPFRLDVTQPDQALAAVAFAGQRYGPLDILVNNAGVTTRAPFLEMTLDAWERILKVNLTGTMLCGQAAARAMASASGGAIINIASISGQRGGSGRAAYGASKAGVINLTAVMAVELGPRNIRVNAIAPGPTDVEQAHSTSAQRQATYARMALPRAATPADIASAAVFLASDESGMVTGHVLNVDGGFQTAGIIWPDEPAVPRP